MKEEICLGAPYECQYDSKTREGGRMCFSCSSSMLLRYLRHDELSKADELPQDVYLRELEALGGDTTDHDAQVRTLAHYGLKARFVSQANWDTVDHQLALGMPVPIGIYIHGVWNAPIKEGGHWILVIGRSSDGSAYLCHDPAGELDVVGGGYSSGNAGEKRVYSKAHMTPRWQADGANTGWCLIAEK